MGAERDILSRVVVPSLNKRLEPHGVYLELVDLRCPLARQVGLVVNECPRWGQYTEADQVGVGPGTMGSLEMSLRTVSQCDMVLHLAGAVYGNHHGSFPSVALT